MGPRGVSSSAAARRERTACTITAIRGASRVNAQGGTLRVLRHDAAWRRVAPSHLCGAATLLQAGQLRGRQHRGLSREHRHAMAAGRKRRWRGPTGTPPRTLAPLVCSICISSRRLLLGSYRPLYQLEALWLGESNVDSTLDFDKLDKNSNGKLEFKEFQKMHELFPKVTGM